MRLSAPRAMLTRLDATDFALAQALATCRGAFTRADYEYLRGISKSGAVKRLAVPLMTDIFAHLRPEPSDAFPALYFVRGRYARQYARTYLEPQSLHGLLDALLRSTVDRAAGPAEGAVWTHNGRHAAVRRQGSRVDVIDCLDRSEAAVIRLAEGLSSGAAFVHVHSGSEVRARRMTLLLGRPGDQGGGKPAAASARASDLSWESLFDGTPTPPKPATQTLRRAEIHIVCHGIHAFKMAAHGMEA